ncbi:hypothetical protein QOZ83_16535 [Romboutsia sedimentorum]|uniref:hypothetical protein n=1 Tax=Romboutsia sedimentorum TaxID=1368474 RepID=UPI0024DEEF00|nr:hypothetical protein [Romboutsia sedimentorum]MDK2587448.1 hypothetical protein [Romboutsia sedimentorum]
MKNIEKLEFKDIECMINELKDVFVNKLDINEEAFYNMTPMQAKEKLREYKEKGLIKSLAKEAIKEMILDDELKISEKSFNNDRKKIYLSALDSVDKKWKSNKSHYVVVDEVSK